MEKRDDPICIRLQAMFNECAKPIYSNPISTHAVMANEAQKFNCTLLAKEIFLHCQKTSLVEKTKL